jgi:hypothetical protein
MTTVLIAGSLSGLISDAVVHPLDTLRTLQQTNHGSESVVELARNIIRGQGIRQLYKGFAAVAVGSIPGHALYFYGYEYSKKVFSNFEIPSTVNHLCSGFLADICGAIVWTPMDVIKQRLQTHAISSTSTPLPSSITPTSSFIEFKRTIQSDGILGLYKGFGAALLTYGPYVSIYFALYELFKSETIRLRQNNEERLPFYFNLSGAALAGAISAVLTCPLDVVKTRIQVQSESTSFKYSGVVDAFRQITRKEGFRGLFAGVKPRALWMSGGTAITMMVYEELKAIL